MASDQKSIQVPGYLKISKVALLVFYFYILLGIISLTLRIFLLLFNANSTAGFYKLVANTSSGYLQPFRGIFPTPALQSGGYLDVSALFAIVVYLFILWGVHSLVSYVQNKIDITTAQQEQELAEIRHQKQLAAANAGKAAVGRPVRVTSRPSNL